MLKFEFFQNKQISLYRGTYFKVFNFVRFFKNQFLNKLYFILLSNFKNLLLKSAVLHSGVLLGGYTKSPPIALHPPRPVALGGCGRLVALPHSCPLARPRSPPFWSRKVFTPWMVLSGLNTPLKT